MAKLTKIGIPQIAIPEFATLFAIPESASLFAIPESATLFAIPESATLFAIPESASGGYPGSIIRKNHETLLCVHPNK